MAGAKEKNSESLKSQARSHHPAASVAAMAEASWAEPFPGRAAGSSPPLSAAAGIGLCTSEVRSSARRAGDFAQEKVVAQLGTGAKS